MFWNWLVGRGKRFYGSKDLMKHLLCVFLFAVLPCFSAEKPALVYELRTYHAEPGKLDALQSRFRDHTASLFEKHGMTNVGYWIPEDNEGNLLIYLLSYPSREARETSWKGFLADKDWQAAYQASIEDGKLVGKIDSLFLTKTDFSADFGKGSGAPRLFEMRTYTTADGMLPHLHKRFREHTLGLFAEKGMTNLAYFEVMAGQENSENLLLYFLAHESAEAAQDSWTQFRKNPDWQAVAKASEVAAGGKLLVKDGVKSTYLKATDFSPVK